MDTAILASFGFHKQLYASLESDGSFHNPNDIIPGNPKRLWMRVSRRNADITVSMSPDGQSWLPVSFRSFAELPETLWVGVSFYHRSGGQLCSARDRKRHQDLPAADQIGG